jgi:hypothetical protein
MNTSKITDQNNVLYRQMTVNNLEKRHETLRIEEMRVREALKNNEAKRVEMNRQMNRSGQNIDKLV